MDQKKIADLSLGLAGVIAFWILFKLVESLTGFFNWNFMPGSPVSLDLIIGIVGGVAVFVALRTNKKVHTFTEEVVNEMTKVTWPARKETLASGVVVLIMVGVAALIMSFFDSIWGSLAQKILTIN